MTTLVGLARLEDRRVAVGVDPQSAINPVVVWTIEDGQAGAVVLKERSARSSSAITATTCMSNAAE